MVPIRSQNEPFWGDGAIIVPTSPGLKAFNQTHAGNMLSEYAGW